MKLKGEELRNQIKKLLEENQYMFGRQLAKHFKVCVGTICLQIRKMREDGIGVHVTKHGYTLSEFATKKDDVGFLRRLYGRRASDFYAVQAALPHINHRWNSVEEKDTLKILSSNFGVNLTNFKKGLKLLTEKSKTLSLEFKTKPNIHLTK
jgi:biotin operon repressor